MGMPIIRMMITRVVMQMRVMTVQMIIRFATMTPVVARAIVRKMNITTMMIYVDSDVIRSGVSNDARGEIYADDKHGEDTHAIGYDAVDD